MFIWIGNPKPRLQRFRLAAGTFVVVVVEEDTFLLFLTEAVVYIYIYIYIYSCIFVQKVNS